MTREDFHQMIEETVPEQDASLVCVGVVSNAGDLHTQSVLHNVTALSFVLAIAHLAYELKKFEPGLDHVCDDIMALLPPIGAEKRGLNS